MPRVPNRELSATHAVFPVRGEARRVLNFAGCNYLGLAHEPRVHAAAIRGMGKYGLTTTASRETTGNTDAHTALETELAEFLGMPAAILTTEGYTANVALCETLGHTLRARKWKHAIAYLEFHGPGSFAGEHAAEPHSVTLFDVSADKRGLLEPAVFRGLFQGVVAVPRVLHAWPVDDAFVARVRASELPGLTFEGVVAKGAYASPGLPRMFKIKTQRWLERLRVKCGDDETLFERLR